MKILNKIFYHILKRLTIYYEDGIGIKSVKKRRHLKKLKINFARYKLFDKKWSYVHKFLYF